MKKFINAVPVVLFGAFVLGSCQKEGAIMPHQKLVFEAPQEQELTAKEYITNYPTKNFYSSRFGVHQSIYLNVRRADTFNLMLPKTLSSYIAYMPLTYVFGTARSSYLLPGKTGSITFYKFNPAVRLASGKLQVVSITPQEPERIVNNKWESVKVVLLPINMFNRLAATDFDFANYGNIQRLLNLPLK